ncbi:hypothetical protein BH11PLA1_BH11PLA1_06460 [soil metagenome]
MNHPAASATPASNRTTNLLLGALTLMLGVNTLVQLGAVPVTITSAATAQPGTPGPAPLNSSEFARRTADGVSEINTRLARIEGRFDKALQVKIIESVPLQVQGLPKAETAAAPETAK